MQASRRTIVRGAAWTAPAVIVTGAAPAFAATEAGGCGPAIHVSSPAGRNDEDRAVIAGWIATLGSLAPVPSGTSPYTANWTYQPRESRFGTSRWVGWVFESWRDSAWANTQSSATTENRVVSPTFEVVAGATYTFTFQVRGGWGNNDENAQSAAQRLTLSVGGSTIYDKSTRGGSHHYGHASAGPASLPWLSTTASDTTNNGLVANLMPVVETATFTPTTSGPVSLTMTTTLYPRHVNSNRPSGANWNVGGDDLMVGIPSITCG